MGWERNPLKFTTFILAGVMACSVWGCGSKETERSDQSETKIMREEEPSKEETPETESEEPVFSFADLADLQFSFSSGAGGWETLLTIDADGSFSGEYFDGELGSTGDEYPNGTVYQCDFSGQFTQPVKVNDFTYAMQISELHYERKAGTEEIKNGMLFCYTDVYGLDGAEDILIYLPGAPLAELPEEFRSWVGYYDLSDTAETELPFYALNNEALQYGFSGYNVIDELKKFIAYVEETAASLENSIENDPLTQTEYNDKTQDLYEWWDEALNRAWDVLKQVKDAETMQALTAEEREWIASKEEAVAEAGAEYEGGSMQPMVMNQKAAEMTRDRVYELLKLLD